MNFKKFVRLLWISLAVIVGLLVLFLAISIVPPDNTVNYESLLDTMSTRIDALDDKSIPSKRFSVGFAKVNLTPSHPVSTAGKKRAKHFVSVHDSIYVRTMVIDNGANRVAIVSADLLIIPPTVTALLEKELPDIDFTLDNTYLGATHSHSSIGGWGKGVTSMIYGSFNDSIVQFIADKIKLSIHQATQNMLPATLKVNALPIRDGVYNRVTEGGPVDPLLRAIEVLRSDSSKLLLLSYTAHATCLSSRDFQLSRDYPGKLVDIMEKEGYTFTLFIAGAVGSHGANAPEQGWKCVDWMASEIAAKFIAHKIELRPVKDSTLEMYRVTLELAKLQPKVLHDLRLRPWVFRAALGEYPTYISALRIGDVVMLGTPCDFSGEFNASLDSLAAKINVFPIVTGFNGAYIGYLTPEKYYDVDHYETQLMNWYGAGNGEYVKKCLEKLMLKIADD